MPRRFQFSLKMILGLTGTVCLLLGGRHLLETYGNRLDVENATIGNPIRVRATYFCLFGPAECYFEIGYKTADGSQLSDGPGISSHGYRIKRSWLCLYSIESELKPVDRSCRLIVEFKRYDKPWARGRMWMLQEKTIDAN